jgi:hypothetical protein
VELTDVAPPRIAEEAVTAQVAPPSADAVVVWAVADLPVPVSADVVLADLASVARHMDGKLLVLAEWAMPGKASAAAAVLAQAALVPGSAALVSVAQVSVAKHMVAQAWVGMAGKANAGVAGSVVQVTDADVLAWAVPATVVVVLVWAAEVMAAPATAGRLSVVVAATVAAACIGKVADVPTWVAEVVVLRAVVQVRPRVDVVREALVAKVAAHRVVARKLAARAGTVPARKVLAASNKAVSAALRAAVRRAPAGKVAEASRAVRAVSKVRVPMAQAPADSKAVAAARSRVPALVAAPLPSMRMTTSDP